MKQVILFLLAAILILNLSSCSKSNVKFSQLSSLEIINTVPGSPGAQFFGLPNAVSYGSFGQYGLVASNSTQIYVWPTGDSTHPYYDNTFSAVNGGIYSLFLVGPDQNDAIFVKDTIPSYADSSMGVRFINLSPDAGTISVDNATTPGTPLVAALAYKSITSFNKLTSNAVNMANGDYNFEIRNAADSVIYTMNQPPVTFKNVTIVIDGMVSDGSISAFTVNNY